MFLLSMGSVQAATKTAIHIATYRPNHPEYSWLKRFLTLRGYHPSSKSSTLSLKLLAGSKVLVMKGKQSQHYSIPTQVTSPVTRARMCTMYLDMFLEQLQQKPKPMPVSFPPPEAETKATAKRKQERRFEPKAKAKKQPIQKLREQPKARIKRRRRRMVRTRKAVLRSALSKPRKAAVVVRQTPAALPKPKPQPRTIPRQQPEPRQQPKPRQQPEPRRQVQLRPKTKTKTNPRKRKVAGISASKVMVRARVPRPLPTRVWGTKLSLDLGLSGGFRWSSENAGITNRTMGGGSALLGLNFFRWTIRIDLNFHSYFLQKQNRPIAFVRPSFWLGFRIPMGQAERWLQLYAMLGTGTDFYVEEQGKTYKTTLQWGIAAALQLHWSVTKRWSLFLRPSLLLFPGGLGITLPQGAFLSAPTIQVSGLAGFQVRF